jgi:hypothetical protein
VDRPPIQSGFLGSLFERLLVTTLQTPRRHLKYVIRHVRIGTRQPIENVVEWKLGIVATSFVASDHALRFLKGSGVDEYKALLFGNGIKEIARHTSQNSIAADNRGTYAPASFMPSFHKPPLLFDYS